jgi:hypothetical protein
MPRERIGLLLKKILIELRGLGGKADPKGLFSRVEATADLSDYERSPLTSGRLRWINEVSLYSSHAVHARYLERRRVIVGF